MTLLQYVCAPFEAKFKLDHYDNEQFFKTYFLWVKKWSSPL